MDRNKQVVMMRQMAQLDEQRATIVKWMIALLNDRHGGQALVTMDALMRCEQNVFQVTRQDDRARGMVRFTVCDKDMKPLVTVQPSGISAQVLAEKICANQPDKLVVLDADSLAQLFETYEQNVERGKMEARLPKLADPPETPEPRAERCPECFLAYGIHRDDCSRKVQTSFGESELHDHDTATARTT